jgi:hypothetical protein
MIRGQRSSRGQQEISLDIVMSVERGHRRALVDD